MSSGRSQRRIYPAKPGGYLFATRLIDPLSPEAALDTVRLRERAGIRVDSPEGQTRCGQPGGNKV